MADPRQDVKRRASVPPPDGIECFLLLPTSRVWRSLRRYSKHDARCKGNGSFHNAHFKLGQVESLKDGTFAHDLMPCPPPADPRWPLKCDHCDYVFKRDDAYQVFEERVYVTAKGAEHSLRKPPVGAMWNADWLPESMQGDDGQAIMVQTPGGKWLIDGPASNCTKPDDRGKYPKHHRCWIRHGIPPKLTVDKQGVSCNAGAGSIQCGNYHGFLRHGFLTKG